MYRFTGVAMKYHGKKEVVRTLVCKAQKIHYCHNYARTINKILEVYSFYICNTDLNKGRKWL